MPLPHLVLPARRGLVLRVVGIALLLVVLHSTRPEPRRIELARAERRPSSAVTGATAAAAAPVTTTTAAPPAETTATTVPAPVVSVAAARPPTPGALPVGKGMWIWLPERAEGGNAQAIAQRAVANGLSHIYVRTGSSWQDFTGGPFLDQILPAAHAAGLRVYGWDFPNLRDIQKDVNRGLMAIGHVTPDGHRLDGFAPDIETHSEGTNLHADTVNLYMRGIRWPIGPTYPLIVTVPRPSERLMHGGFPYREAIQEASAVAPMVYWLNRQPEPDLLGAMSYLGQFGKPVIPVGQAYDGAPEGGRPGPPPPDEISRFMRVAQETGALGASFWSWQHASDEIWRAIHGAGEFTQAPAPPALSPDELGVVQLRLHVAGQPVPTNGRWDPPTREAVRWFQAGNGLTPTGDLTEGTLARLGLRGSQRR